MTGRVAPPYDRGMREGATRTALGAVAARRRGARGGARRQLAAIPLGLWLLSCGQSRPTLPPDRAPMRESDVAGACPPSAPERDETPRQIAVSDSTTCVRVASGGVRCWARETSPRLVPGVDCASQIAVAGAHGCAIIGGGVRCWGPSAFGALESTQDGQRGSTPVRGLPPRHESYDQSDPVDHLAVGDTSACGVVQGGRTYCWGLDDHGLSGKVPERVLGLPRMNKIALGRGHACGVTSDYEVYCWGRGDRGQLGLGDRLPRSAPVLVPGLKHILSVAAGAEHTCALDNMGRVHCWGRGDEGQLGDGTRNDRLAPGDTLPISAIVELAAGRRHTCATVSNREVYCWGNNEARQVDPTLRAPRRLGRDVRSLLSGAGLAVGDDRTCALYGEGLACWGGGQESREVRDRALRRTLEVAR